MIEQVGQIRRRDVQEELGISQPMAVKLLKGLLEKDAIIGVGTGKMSCMKKENKLSAT